MRLISTFDTLTQVMFVYRTYLYDLLDLRVFACTTVVKL